MAAVNRTKSVRLQHEESSESEIELETARALQNAIFPSRNNTPVSISACLRIDWILLFFFSLLSALFRVIYLHFLKLVFASSSSLLRVPLSRFTTNASSSPVRSGGNGGISDETNILISAMEATLFQAARRQVGVLERSRCKCVIFEISYRWEAQLMFSLTPAAIWSRQTVCEKSWALSHSRRCWKKRRNLLPFHFTTIFPSFTLSALHAKLTSVSNL